MNPTLKLGAQTELSPLVQNWVHFPICFALDQDIPDAALVPTHMRVKVIGLSDTLLELKGQVFKGT